MLSTFFLGFYESLKGLKVIDRESIFDTIKAKEDELSDLLKGQGQRAEIGIFIVDLVTYKLWGVNFGHLCIKSNEDRFFEGNDNNISAENFKTSEISFQLKRGEKLFLISPGYLKSAKESIGKRKALDLIDDSYGKDSSEALSDLFFQVKKNDLNSDFLKCDSSILCLEVDPNAIMQV